MAQKGALGDANGVRIVVPGGLILDRFVGAGTTGVAALAEGRRFMGIELHHGFAAIARRRLAAVVRFRERGGDGDERRSVRRSWA